MAASLPGRSTRRVHPRLPVRAAHPEVVIGLVSIERRSGPRSSGPAITATSASLAWSPDGTRLAYTAEVDPPRFLVGDVPPIARAGSSKADDDEDADRAADHADRLALRRRRPPRSLVAPVRRRDPAWGAGSRSVTAGDWGVDRDRLEPRRPDRGVHRGSRPGTGPPAADDHLGRRRRRRRQPREVLASPGWAVESGLLARRALAGGDRVLEAEPLDDVSPGPPRRPERRVRAAACRSRPTSTGPIGNWTDTDLNGWLVDSRPGPIWMGRDRIVATVSDRGRSHPWGFDLHRTGRADAADAHPIVDGDLTTHCLAVSAGGRRRVVARHASAARAMELLTVEAARPAPPSLRRPDPHHDGLGVAAPAPDAGDDRGRGARARVARSRPGSPRRRTPGARALPTVVDVHGGPLGAWAPAPAHRGRRCSSPAATASSCRTSAAPRPTAATGSGRSSATGAASTPRTSTPRSTTSIALGLADPDRLGVLGLSYGGFMVNWLVGTSDRFRAAVTRERRHQPGQRLGQLRHRARVQPEGAPRRPADARRRRASSGASRRCATSRTSGRRCCILQAEADLRCPPPDNEQLFVALRNLGRTVEYVLYPEEYHVFPSSGRPDRRIDRRRGCSTGSTGTCAPDQPGLTGPQARLSSGRGSASWRVAARWPASAARWSDAAVERPAARAVNQPTRNPASKASPAPVVSRPGRAGWRPRSGAAPVLDGQHRRALRPALDDRDRRELEQPVDGITAEAAPRPPGGREQQVRVTSAMSDRAARRPSASSGPIEARSTLTSAPAARARSMARRPAARVARRGASRPAGGAASMPRNQPGRRSAGPELVGRAAVGDERPLAAGATRTPIRPVREPATRRTRGVTPSRPDGVDERPARPCRGRPRRRAGLRAEPAEPAGRVGGRAALAERDPARDVRPGLERSGRREDDVEHEVAEDEDPGGAGGPDGRPGVRGRPGRRGRGRPAVDGMTPMVAAWSRAERDLQ